MLASLVVGLALSCVSGSAGETTVDRPAIPLFTPNPTTPDAARGSGGMPSARLKLTIDENGRVTKFEVLRLDPPSEYDAALKQSIEAAVKKWRFGPALKASTRVATEQELTISFMTAGDHPREPERLAADAETADRRDDQLYQQSANTLSLDNATQQRLQREAGDKAEILLDKAKRTTFANEWFEVVTDSGSGPQQAEAIAGALAAGYEAVNELIGNRLATYPAAGKVRAYVFRTEQKYKQFVKELGDEYDWSAGFYDARGIIAFHSEMPSPSDLYSVLIHEATHAALDRHMVRRGVRLPRWLDEGFASYLGNSDIENGKLKFGQHKHGGNLRFYGIYMAKLESMSKAESKEAQRAVREGEALSVPEIVSANIETFYGDRRGLYYAEGWLLVHFLRHGDPSWAKHEFPRFMLYALEGFEIPEVLQQVYRSDLKTLDEKFQAYVKKF